MKDIVDKIASHVEKELFPKKIKKGYYQVTQLIIKDIKADNENEAIYKFPMGKVKSKTHKCYPIYKRIKQEVMNDVNHL